jgi:hypothetical protein
MGFELFRLRPPLCRVATTLGPPRTPRARTSHPSKLFPRRQQRRVTATHFPSHCWVFRLFPSGRHSISRFCSIVESVASRWRFHQCSARCSLGLGSSSRCSLLPDCPSGQPRSAPAVAVLLWATFTEVTAPWMLLSPKRSRDKHEACPPQRPPSENGFCSVPGVSTRATGLPIYTSLPLDYPSRPLVHFFPSRSDSVGILTTTGSCFRGHLRKKWRWFHVSPNLGHECLKSLARPKTHRFHRSDHNSHFVSPKTNYLKHSLGFASKWCCRPAETV